MFGVGQKRLGFVLSAAVSSEAAVRTASWSSSTPAKCTEKDLEISKSRLLLLRDRLDRLFQHLQDRC